MLNCLAIDVGAGSGRIIRGNFEDDRISLEEVHRFENEMEMIDGHLRWDVGKLFSNICEGLRKASASGERPASLGVDTWGVDFVLLDEEGDSLEMPVAYRDARTDGMMERFFEVMDRATLYSKTGIQFAQFNTLFQLFAMVCEQSPLLEKAKNLLMMPDLLHYLLTGEKRNEFTIASTSQLINARTRDWDADILASLGINEQLFQSPIMPGEMIGHVKAELLEETNLAGTPVYAVATHDTGSAVAAVPAQGKDWAYISSGTWCLMGVESDTPATDQQAFDYNLTNEGGVNGTFRILKNIMGLWLIRGIKSSLDTDYSYPQLIAMAQDAEPFKHIIHANDLRFYNPPSMVEAIDDFCRQTGQSTPQTPGEYIRCAEEGLALAYRQVLGQLRDVYEHPINRIHILGGGVQDHLMCQLAADATGLPVYAGPVEGTATGNLIIQALALGRFQSLQEARQLIYDSFEIETYTPQADSAWDEAWKKYLNLTANL